MLIIQLFTLLVFGNCSSQPENSFPYPYPHTTDRSLYDLSDGQISLGIQVSLSSSTSLSSPSPSYSSSCSYSSSSDAGDQRIFEHPEHPTRNDATSNVLERIRTFSGRQGNHYNVENNTLGVCDQNPEGQDNFCLTLLYLLLFICFAPFNIY
jgi:hypothetical protein